MNTFRPLAGALALFALAAPALHGARIGDPAAPLTITDWVKGGPVDLADGRGKQVYVVEFWATWCGPCRKSIPHLTELQKKFKDQGVTFIGVSDEDAAIIKPFVEKLGAEMDYVVAGDTTRKTHDGYMKAYNQRGIPTAFVVDKAGNVVWRGHPMAGLEDVISKVLDGSYNLNSALKEAELDAKRDQWMTSANDYARLVIEGEGGEKAAELGRKLVADAGPDPGALNQFAWFILTNDRIKHRDLNLALSAAKAALDASGGKDPAIVDTYARALFEKGDMTGAIEQQKKAVALCADEEMRTGLEKTLQSYQERLAAK